MSRLKKYNEFINTRVGFFSLLIGLLWLKNMFAYVVDFHLSIQNPMQLFILLINPLSVSMLLISIGLFIKRSKVAYTTLFIIYGILSIWLFLMLSIIVSLLILLRSIRCLVRVKFQLG